MDRCPLCGAPLVEIRAKAVCSGCGRIVEGCCEGAPGTCGALGSERRSDVAWLARDRAGPAADPVP